MILYLIRHGLAKESSAGQGLEDDLRRPLSQEGRKRTRRAARGMAALYPAPDLLFCSAAIRSVQTAEELSSVWRCRDIRSEASLNPGTSIDSYIDLLNDLIREEGTLEGMRIAFVTHQPELGDLLARLIAGDVEGEKGQGFTLKENHLPFTVSLKKASLAVVDCSGVHAELEALYSPSVLRRIAKM